MLCWRHHRRYPHRFRRRHLDGFRPEVYPLLARESQVELSHRPLNVIGTTHRVQRTGKLDQECIPHCLHLSTIVSYQYRPNELLLCIDYGEGERLIPLTKGCITHQIREHDGCQPSLTPRQGSSLSNEDAYDKAVVG